MKKIKSIAIAALMIVAGTTMSNAQTTTPTPHGGIIQESGEYFVEMVKSGNKCTFYLLDANKKAIANKGISGNVLIKFSDNTSVTTDLSTLGSDGFLVVNDKLNSSTSCLITLKVNGKSVTATFKYATSPAKIEKPHGHSHGEDGHHH